MADMENTVDVGMPEGSAADDAQQAPNGESLSTILEEAQETQEEQEAAQGQKGGSEPGWIKQRVSKAVEKAVAEAEARMRALYETQLAQLNADRVERQAQELVRRGEFRSLETAKEYLTLKGGQPRQAQPEENQQEVDPVIQAKADLLAGQARRIKESRGVDVMAAYNQDPQIQQRIANGEWDFYDVAEYLSSRRNPPSPARSANGGRADRTSISDMTDAQWKRLNENLAKGKRYNVRNS